MQCERLKHRLWLCGLFFGFFFAYTSVQNIGYFDASDSYSRFHMMKSLVSTGSPHWSTPNTSEPQVCLNSLGPALSPLPFQLIGYVCHKFTSTDASLDQFLIRSTLMANVFYTALWMCLIAVLSLRIGASRGQATALALATGFCTLVFPYTKTAQGENQIGLCLTGITILLLRLEHQRKLRYALGAGLLYAFMIVSKTELLVLAPILFLAVAGWLSQGGLSVSRWRLIGVFCLAMLPGIVLTLWYNYIRFGSALSSGHLGDQHGESLLKPFSHPFWSGLYIQLLSPGKGIIWYCPVLLISLPLLGRLLMRQSRVLWVPYICWGVLTCVYSKWYSPAGDTSLGSRFQVSYLAFGVLPLLCVLSSGRRGRLGTVWTAAVIGLSLLAQLVFCLVSFNVDFHKQIEGLDPLAKFEKIYAQYYGISDSLIWGFFRTLSHGFLDMNFVRFGPLESGLVVLPALWWFLGLSLAGFAFAIWATRDFFPSRHWRTLICFQTPAMVCFVLAIVRAGYPADRGLELTMSHPESGKHETIVQDINIGNLNDGREVYKLYTPVSLKWKGRIQCETPGAYSVQVVANREVSVLLSGNRQQILPSSNEAFFAVENPGWKRFEIRCEEAYMFDSLQVLIKGPNDTVYKALADWSLAH